MFLILEAPTVNADNHGDVSLNNTSSNFSASIHNNHNDHNGTDVFGDDIWTNYRNDEQEGNSSYYDNSEFEGNDGDYRYYSSDDDYVNNRYGINGSNIGPLSPDIDTHLNMNNPFNMLHKILEGIN